MSRKILPMTKPQTFGEAVRKLRELRKMPLRKLAAILDIDQSTLSKIERNERRANAETIEKLSSTFEIDKEKLYMILISDKVANDLLGEENFEIILKIAKRKIDYMKAENCKIL